MKKIALTSLLAVFAIPAISGGANAAVEEYGHWRVRMDGNPLYRPMEGRAYSMTSFETTSDWDYFSLAEEVGMGISDTLAFSFKTSGSYDSSDEPRYGTKYNWDEIQLGLSWRYVDEGPWVADLYGKGQILGSTEDGIKPQAWNWTAGTTFGFIGWDRWTVAFTAQADYMTNARGDFSLDAWGMKVAMDGLFNFDEHWNIIGGVNYNFNLDEEYYNNNPLNVKLGANYNFDDWSFLGVYVEKDIKNGFNVNPMAIGARFGIDF
ncbi:MAG: hypothetical protein LBF37_01455 [Rickettsiales bacterium]|jgi:hypothetical protein|nr:hypothetical protein [Rickettsiales bacterium]